jgi:hypothetical protein
MKGRDRGYREEATVTHEGGVHPLKMAHMVAVETLDLPIGVRRLILEAIEDKDGSKQLTEGTDANDNGDEGEA